MNPLQYPPDAGDGCWNRIGVWGTQTPRCPVLEQVIHCRNCPIYSSAGRDVLNRPAPSGYVQEWTEVLARPALQAATRSESVLIFRVDEERLALPTGLMHQVLTMRPIHVVPHRSNEVLLGLANLQGRLQLCLSLRGILGLPQDPGGAARFMLVFGRQEERFALPVDEVLGLSRYDVGQLGETRIGSHVKFVYGVVDFRGQPVGLLDADHVCGALSGALYR